jgi:hypothetical protein
MCSKHGELFQVTPMETDLYDWLKYEFERLNGGPVAPKVGKCIYPNCQAPARECVPYFFPDGDDASQGQELFCKWHRGEWGCSYTRNPFEWCKLEYERINTECVPPGDPVFRGPEICECRPEDSILLEADSIVNGARATDYGDCIESFTKVSTMASIMANRALSPMECVLVLKAVKLVREAYKHKRDNLVDECGYTEIESRIQDHARAGGFDDFMENLVKSVDQGY